MCFSAQASFTAAAMLTMVGGITMIKSPPRMRAIACIPLIFALQQAFEGIIWVTLKQGDMTSVLHNGAVYGFTAIAGIFWPIWIPGTLYALETNQRSKKLLFATLCGGVLVSLWCVLGYMLMGRGVLITNHHLSYPNLSSTFGNLPMSFINGINDMVIVIYMLISVGAPIISSVKSAWVLGVLVGFGWIIAFIYYYMTFGSVWCYFAAIASLVTYYVVWVNAPSKQ